MPSEIQYLSYPRQTRSQSINIMRDIINDMENKKRQNRSLSSKQSVQSSPTASPVQDKNVSAKPKQTRKKNPMTYLSKLVNEHNALIDLNDRSRDLKFDLDDYYDPNSPSYIDPSDSNSIKEEQNYLQNRIYKLNGDRRYVPDYEDMKEMDDTEYMKYIDDLGMEPDENGSGKVYQVHDKTDNMSDDEFTKFMKKSTGESIKNTF